MIEYMTVAELRRLLEAFPADAEVVVPSTVDEIFNSVEGAGQVVAVIRNSWPSGTAWWACARDTLGASAVVLLGP